MDRARPNPRAGPVTGALERPSQHSPENRKAEQRSDPHDAQRSARALLRSAHAAERQFQHAAQLDERHHLRAGLLAEARRSFAIASALIDARFADRRRALADISDANARAAAAQQITLEQRAEHDQLATTHRQTVRALRRAAQQPLALRHRGERRALSLGQRHQRAVLGIILQKMRPRPLQDHETWLTRRVRIAPAFLRAGKRST